MDAPTPESIGSSSSTVAPWVMSDWACACSVASLPCALVMMNWLRPSPAACKARARSGASNSVYRGEVVVSGSSTPILPVPIRLSPASLRITEKSLPNAAADTDGITEPSAAADRDWTGLPHAVSPAAAAIAASSPEARRRGAVMPWRTGSPTAAR